MTMAILKCEDFNSQQAIWCYADSCISTDSGVLTNHAMKIYEIQTKQYAYDQTMHKHLLHRGCLGFVYAGPVNIAMQTYVNKGFGKVEDFKDKLCEYLVKPVSEKQKQGMELCPIPSRL